MNQHAPRRKSHVGEGSSACAVAFLLERYERYMETNMARPPLPPFTAETAALKARLAEDAWNSRNPQAVSLAYEWHDDSGQHFRSYGNENSEFDEQGLMRVRIASINDLPIAAADRKYHWPLGRRQGDHPGLSALGL
jgi:uncharacterized protein